MKVLIVALIALAPLVVRANPPAKDPKVERIWKSKCASCHGADGKAQVEQGKKMKMHDITTAAWQKAWTDEQIKDVIVKGVDEQKEGVHKQMDGYKEKLKDDQIMQLVTFCRALAQ